MVCLVSLVDLHFYLTLFGDEGCAECLWLAKGMLKESERKVKWQLKECESKAKGKPKGKPRKTKDKLKES